MELDETWWKIKHLTTAFAKCGIEYSITVLQYHELACFFFQTPNLDQEPTNLCFFLILAPEA